MENSNVRKRKALLILPLVVIPFLTLAFWSFGGGKGNDGKPMSDSGLNLQLPNAHLKGDEGNDKLSFYKIAEDDSAKFRKEVKNDPSFQKYLHRDSDTLREGTPLSSDWPASKINDGSDPNEQKVYQKLRVLNMELKNNEGTTEENSGLSRQETNGNKNSVDRLEYLIQKMQKDSDSDPEIEQLNSMMEKILDIQHPQRVSAREEKSNLLNSKARFIVHGEISPAAISLLDTGGSKNEESGFYGLEQEAISTTQDAIEAVVHENQTLVSGSVVKLRLLTDIDINGKLIPKDNFIFGICKLDGERLEVDIHCVRSGNSLYPVNMEVYDMDGMKGIYIPEALTRDVAKQSADNGLQTLGLSTLDPSIQAQAATAGIRAAKTLISKKVKQIRVFVKAGYKILLKDKNLPS